MVVRYVHITNRGNLLSMSMGKVEEGSEGY